MLGYADVGEYRGLSNDFPTSDNAAEYTKDDEITRNSSNIANFNVNNFMNNSNNTYTARSSPPQQPRAHHSRSALATTTTGATTTTSAAITTTAPRSTTEKTQPEICREIFAKYDKDNKGYLEGDVAVQFVEECVNVTVDTTLSPDNLRDIFTEEYGPFVQAPPLVFFRGQQQEIKDAFKQDIWKHVDAKYKNKIVWSHLEEFLVKFFQRYPMEQP